MTNRYVIDRRTSVRRARIRKRRWRVFKRRIIPLGILLISLALFSGKENVKANDVYLIPNDDSLIEMEEVPAISFYIEEMVEEEDIIKNRITEFCKLYSFDDESTNKIYERLEEVSGSFTSLDDNMIPGVTFKGSDAHTDNIDLLLLMAVRCAKQAPAKLGLSYADLNIGDIYKSPYNDTLTIAYFANIIGIDPAYAYGVMIAETGLKEGLYITNNNPGNIKFSGKFASFDSISEGIVETILELYKFKCRGLDTYEKLAESRLYDESGYDSPWYNNATAAYKEALLNFDELFVISDQGLKY